jgi:phospholipase/carboxylesterase
MRRVEFAGFSAILTGGTDREGGGDGPLVVFAHGYGAPGDDLVPLYRVLDVPRETRFLFPAAPLELDTGYGVGRAWWPIDMARLERALLRGDVREANLESPPELPAMRERFDALVREAEEALGAEPQRTVVCGFSQGSMLACDWAFATSRPLGGLVVLSGTLLCPDAWRAAMPTRAGLPVLQSHGMSDPLLPFANAEALHHAMAAAGLRVEWHPFRGGHTVDDGTMKAIERFLSRVQAADTVGR